MLTLPLSKQKLRYLSLLAIFSGLLYFNGLFGALLDELTIRQTFSTTVQKTWIASPSIPKTDHNSQLNPQPSPDTLTLYSPQAIWADIKDHSGQRLAYQLLSAQQTHHFTGFSPFHIKLGHLNRVLITLNGQTIPPQQTRTFTLTQKDIQNPNPSDSPLGLTWLNLSETTTEHWSTHLSSDNPNLMTIQPLWESKTLSPKILGLIPKESESYNIATSTLLEVLYQQNITAHVTLIYFDNQETLGKHALQLAEQLAVDLIFSMGSESAALVHDFYTGGKIPVVTCTNKDPVALGQIPNYEQGSGTNIAYTSLNVPLTIQMQYLLELKPHLKNVALMYDATHAQVMATEVIPAQKAFAQHKIQVINIAVTDRKNAENFLKEQMPKALSTLKLTDPSLNNSLFWITSSTSIFTYIATISQLADKVPVLGSIPNIVTEGRNSAVLAIGIDRRNNAHLASLYAVKILKGEAQPGDLKVGIITPPDVAINFQVAQAIGLKIPFSFFESASFIYDYEGKIVRAFGQKVQ